MDVTLTIGLAIGCLTFIILIIGHVTKLAISIKDVQNVIDIRITKLETNIHYLAKHVNLELPDNV